MYIIYTYVYIYIYLYIYIYIYTYIYIYILNYVYVYIYIYIYGTPKKKTGFHVIGLVWLIDGLGGRYAGSWLGLRESEGGG